MSQHPKRFFVLDLRASIMYIKHDEQSYKENEIHSIKFSDIQNVSINEY